MSKFKIIALLCTFSLLVALFPQGNSVVIAEETDNEVVETTTEGVEEEVVLTTETPTPEIEQDTTVVDEVQGRQMVAQIPETIVKQGTIGTVNWTLNDMNVLTFSAGTLSDDTTGWKNTFDPKMVSKIIFEGPVIAGTSLDYFFKDFSEMTEIVNLNLLDTSNATSMVEMFSACAKVTSLDLSNFNTSKVTDMSRMFLFLMSVPVLNINHFDTSSVTSMAGMFGFASQIQTFDLSAWNTSKVTDMSGMFYMMDSLTNVNVNTWNTSSLSIAFSMFEECPKLVSVDLSNWDVSSLTDIRFMFRNSRALTSVNISTWNTVALTNQVEMFIDCQNLRSLDLSNWNTNQLTAANSDGVIWGTNIQSITLSPDFSFFGGTADFGLTVPPTNAFYTGKWRHVPTQTEFTNAELDAYDGTLPGQYVWSLMKYDMIFDVNGGEGSIPAIKVDYSTLATQPADPTKAGSRFVGWSTSPTGGTLWNFGSTTMPAQAVTLYAQYATVGTWDDGGPFWTDDCGVITDRWGNVMYKPASCQYKVPNTGVQ